MSPAIDIEALKAWVGSHQELRDRAVRPTFDVGPLRLHGRCAGHEADLWTATEDGFVGVRASAVFAEDRAT